jgi:hypothetical protein
MRSNAMNERLRATHRSIALALAVAAGGTVIPSTSAEAQIVTGADVNTSQKAGADNECAIAKNPANPLQLFVACNTATAGLFAARSTDGGNTWIYPDATDRTIADGDPGQGAAACCDPTLAWDSFGNLYVTYLAALVGGGSPSVETLLSTDGGQTFATIGTFAGSQDQPTVVAANTTAPGAPVAVWVVWNQSGQMRARGAAVTGLGTVGAFGALQTLPGTANCSFGDVAISPAGVVVQVCQTPTGGQGPGNLLVSVDADGLGPGNFGAAAVATATNVGGFDFIPPQNARSVDAEAGLAFDRNPASPRFGRLYLVYTDEVVNEGNDTDIMVRFSDDNGANWGAPIRVNDDPAAPVRSQFLPRIATNPLSGNIAVCWHDARNSPTNTAMQEFCSVATPTPAVPTFIANTAVSAGASTSTGIGVEFGDYSGLAYFPGGGPPGNPRFEHPVWADTSNSTGDNPNGTGNFDAYTTWLRGGPATNEGDPHIRTVDGVHYDFQTAGEYVSLRSADGFEVQTRQKAITTSFFPGPNPHTELATCVSLNSAVAARVGEHEISYQPRLDGVPDPSGLELRIDGVLTALTDAGIALPGGGRVSRSGVGGLEVEFPHGALLVATPGWWASQSQWYLNVGIQGADAYEGIMGAIAPGSWLPALPDGSSLGPKSSSAAQRYDDLNRRFSDAWRVTDDSSLFDYAPGTSTESFTVREWPKDRPSCELPEEPPVEPLDAETAERLCRAIRDENRRENCVFDVTVTGEPGFAETYLLTEKVEQWATVSDLTQEGRPGGTEKPLVFVATVSPRSDLQREPPTGAVQFFLHGERRDDPIPLDSRGRAVWIPDDVDPCHFRVSARYVPDKESPYLASTSREVSYPDRGDLEVYQAKPDATGEP